MFAKPVQEYDSTLPPRKVPTTLAQQLFPSSSPTAVTNDSPVRRQESKVLKPSSSAILNSSRTNVQQGYKNPLKRTASEAHRSNLYAKSPASTMNSSSQSTQDKRKKAEYSRASTYPAASNTTTYNNRVSGNSGVGSLGKLHENVQFYESDFVDDEDLDLDIEEPIRQKKELVTPQLPCVLPISGSAPPNKSTQTSEPPVPWSSSPPHHLVPLHTAQTLPNARHDSAVARDAEQLQVSEAVAVAPPKRRTLPWKDGNDNHPSTVVRASDEQNTEKQRRGRKKHGATVDAEAATPAPKHSTDSPYPWNKTASAVKDEQKRFRQNQQANPGKKMSKDVKGDMGKGKTVKSSRKSVPKVFLSDEQRKVLNLVVDSKKSVFFTGSAGTGKSVLMREIIGTLRRKYKPEQDRVAVTASTGLAACNVGGVTLHSFSGIGLGKESAEELIKKIKKNAKAKNRWIKTKVLVIDEISMVDGDLFDKLEKIARVIRNNGRPFGGIQLVVTGDFFQLPPVPDNNRAAKFAFDAGTWSTAVEHTIGLTQVFRQKDPAFAAMLNEMRVGKLSQESIAAFYKLNRAIPSDDVEATELFPTRHEVESSNNKRMRELGGAGEIYKSIDGGTITDIAMRDRLLANCMAPAQMTLKKGAQVMLIKNIDESLVNGSIGKVVAFMDERTFDVYHETEDDFQSSETMDMDGSTMSESRQKIRAMMNKDAQPGSTSQLYPLVRFKIADGSSRDLLCVRESWKVELPNGEIQAQRSQIPLILAWALSIHKAQGQTLERVRVDLGKIFEKGQAYVALSRATSQEGLEIIRFDPRKVMAHEKVRQFYDSLYSVDKTPPPAAIPPMGRISQLTADEEAYLNDQVYGDPDGYF